MRKYIVPFLTIVLVALSINVYALQKQSAAAPGEVLVSDKDETTAVQMTGLFAVEVTSTGVGTIQIKRSEDNSTNWIVVKRSLTAPPGISASTSMSISVTRIRPRAHGTKPSSPATHPLAPSE